MSVKDQLEQCAKILREISESGYIPFSSPAPSETEQRIKENIFSAIARIESAMFWHSQIYK